LPLELVSGKNDFFEKSFNTNIVRFCFLQAHYRSVLDISNDAMMASEKGFNRLMEALVNLNNLNAQSQSSLDISKWKQDCYHAMNDDFNTPILIAHLFEGVRFINLLKEGTATLTVENLDDFKTTFKAFIFDVLGLENAKDSSGNSDKIEGLVNMLIDMRNLARANKDFKLSDSIRDQLIELGIQLKDGKEGTSFNVQ
jgi:cysteinyl-tRNA synthetase